MSFGLKILSVEPGNTIISPINIAHAFMILRNGADSNTKERITALLEPYLPAKILSDLVEAEELEEVRTAARLFVNEKFEINPEFHLANKQAFGQETQAENVNFQANPTETAKKVNEWVEKSTDGKIKDLVTPNEFTAETCMLIISTIVFKAFWESRFGDARPGWFEEKTRTEFMYKDARCYRIIHNDRYSSCSVPYTGDNGLAMVFLMPKGKLADFEKELTEKDLKSVFDDLAELRQHRGQVSIPKFTLEKKTSLKKTFKALGFGDLFDRNVVHDYSPITNKRLFIEDALHSATIEVGEKGTIATAATKIRMGLAGAIGRPYTPPPRFIADRPFLYFIRHKDSTIFLGRYEKPDKEYVPPKDAYPFY